MNYEHLNMDGWDKLEWVCTYCFDKFYASDNCEPDFQDDENQLCDRCVEILCNYCETCDRWYLKIDGEEKNHSEKCQACMPKR